MIFLYTQALRANVTFINSLAVFKIERYLGSIPLLIVFFEMTYESGC